MNVQLFRHSRRSPETPALPSSVRWLSRAPGSGRRDRRLHGRLGVKRVIPSQGLERSGVISQRRVSLSIVYSVSYETLAGLVKVLMEGGCAGHPAIRGNVERTGCGSPADGVASA